MSIDEKVTIPELFKMKAQREPISMVTAYDFPTARLADRVGIDVVLVGDSVANNVLGYESTVPVTLEEMLHHTRAVRRGVEWPAVQQSHSDWAIRQCKQQAERIMDSGKSKDYHHAARWLERARQAYLAADRADEWRAYLEGLIQKHARKYALRPRLEALRE